MVVEDDAAEGSASRKVMARPAVDRSTAGVLVICMISLKLQLELLHISIGRCGRRVHTYLSNALKNALWVTALTPASQ